MKKFAIIIFLLIAVNTAYAAKLRVVTTYPYIASIAGLIGGDKIITESLARGDYDPHTIIPKPSNIAKLRKADLLIINGAQLEIGWLPPLIQQSNNPRINFDRWGFRDLSKSVTLIETPSSVSRARGDIHPDGNPHYYLDPHNIPAIAQSIANGLSILDRDNADFYQANYEAFRSKWNIKLREWDAKLLSVKNKPMVEYHKLYDYLIRRYGMNFISTIEPLPGIPPTSKHIAELEKIFQSKKIEFILQDVYNSDEAARFLSRKYNVKLVKLPHDVGAVNEAVDIFSLFDEITRRLTR